MIRVPFFLLFGFNKGALNQKGQKGTTQEPSNGYSARAGLGGGGGSGYDQCFLTCPSVEPRKP